MCTIYCDVTVYGHIKRYIDHTWVSGYCNVTVFGGVDVTLIIYGCKDTVMCFILADTFALDIRCMLLQNIAFCPVTRTDSMDTTTRIDDIL